jgi:hypothetical protein
MDLQTGLTRGSRLLTVSCFVNLAFSSLLAAQSTASLSPQMSSSYRRSGGWQASQQQVDGRQASEQQVGEQPVATPQADSPPSAVQRAYFQAQASLSEGMPTLPALGGSPPAASYPPNPLPSLPANSLSGSGSRIPNGPPSLPPSSSRVAVPGGVSGANPESNYQSNGSYPPTGDRPVLPPTYQNTPAPARSNGAVGGNSAAPRTTPAQAVGYPNPATPTAANANSGDLRAIQSDPGGQQPNPRLSAQSITSGLPYVTPAPTGRYATSPYQPAYFQASANQSAGVPTQFASSTRTVPAYLTAQVTSQSPNTLPQYQQPGIYPTAYECATPPAPSYPSTGAVPGSYVPPTLPANMTPNVYTPNNAGFKPFFSLGQESYNVRLGRGIIGQPTVYVPKQPFRNFLRYLSP